MRRRSPEANLGISSNTGDYVTVQTSTAGEQNDWYQFQVVGQRTSYMRAGAFGVNLLTNRERSAADGAVPEGAGPRRSSEGRRANHSRRRWATPAPSAWPIATVSRW